MRFRKSTRLKVLLCILLIVSAAVIFDRYNDTQNTQDVEFIIQDGMSLKKVSAVLNENGIIRSSMYLRLTARLYDMDASMQSGRFVIAPKTSMRKLLQKFRQPDQRYNEFTIPEGYTFYQIASKLEESGIISKEAFIDLSVNIMKDAIDNTERRDVYYSPEGFLFPDTYFIPEGFSEEKIFKMLYGRFQEIFLQEYEKRAEALGLSKNEIITIASLIEKEAANDEERKRIAGVIYNRLEREMPLQIDATVIYGITRGERTMNQVTYEDLKVDSLYNTYLYKGLPPGPIASPGKASIEAALYPEKHDYLYYVLNEGGHVFSKTYSEHMTNVEKYRKNR
ncbi:MAG: endolytic transglycosylase MltG [Bacillota bacterium]